MQTIDGLLKGISKAKMTVMKKRCLYVVIAAIVYNVWKVRNDVYWSAKVWLISNTVKKIREDIQMRLRFALPKKARKSDREWVEFICRK